MRQPNRFRRRLLTIAAWVFIFLLAALVGHLFAAALLGTTYNIDLGPAVGPL